LRSVDSVGGVAAGAVTGLALIWMLGAVALLLPGQTELRRGAQRSAVLRRLNELVPPARVLHALARVDPLPTLTLPGAAIAPPVGAILTDPALRRAAPSVVRISGTACGLGVAGSGWVAAPGLVVTAAHVVAGQRDTTVERAGTSRRLEAEVVAFDPRNDVAVLRAPGLVARPLPLAQPREGEAVAVLGYPNGGPLAAAPGRVGATATVAAQDAYGRGPVERTITSLRAHVRHGGSGGPAIDAHGAVEGMIFAAGLGARIGFAVPPRLVTQALAAARRGRVSSGPCPR
jgi:S1-C subfamily serine protease